MAAMRRVTFFVAASPVLLALAAAPLFHTHLVPAGDSALHSEQHASAVHHAHLPGQRESAPEEGGRHADLDHSSPDTRSFVLLADRPAPDAPGAEVWIAASPAPFHPPILRLERTIAGMRAAIHAPPWLCLASLRAPPITLSI
jgi:hypothetical protein